MNLCYKLILIKHAREKCVITEVCQILVFRLFYCIVTRVNILELRTTSLHFAFNSISNRVSTWFQYFIVLSKQQYF